MKLVSISIIHPTLGDITVNTSVPKDIQEKIGDVVPDYCRTTALYYGHIGTNGDGVFTLNGLMVIQPEQIDVGLMNNSKGNKTFITVMTNKPADIGFIHLIYPNAIKSVCYEESMENEKL